jgi:arylsulfatase A-like enzyme
MGYPVRMMRSGLLDRRRVSWWVCLLLSHALLGCGSGPPPDVLLLVVDTLRADHLGVYGYPRPTSPALDRFAESATIVAEGFAPASWTLPSVGSLFTSTYPSHHGLRVRDGATEMDTMRPDLVTIAEAFHARGYRTVALVTNPWLNVAKHGLARGFDEYRGVVEADADALHRAARKALEEEDRRPLFLYLHYMDVHGPYALPRAGDPDPGQTPTAYRRALKRSEIAAVPRYLVKPMARRLDTYVDAYDRGIRRWDASFGRFVDWLGSTGRLDRTVIAVVSDHGEEFLEHGGWNHGETLYQEQLFVPWILHVPGWSGPSHEDNVVSLIDVGPTLLGTIGAAAPPTMSGRNLLAERFGEEPRLLYAETDVRTGGTPDAAKAAVAMRRGQVKLVARQQGRQCFDLARDPQEQAPSDSACDNEDIAQLDAWVTEIRGSAVAPANVTSQPIDPDVRERLRELGYEE